MTSRGYLLVVLTVLSAFNQLDRQLTAILLEPIRREFALSDVQLGLLSGLAFAVLYSLLSFPAAIWAAYHSRRNLVAAAALLWGAMTALSGLAQSFWQLLAGRVGIGVGEAGAMPPSHAMISDVYPPHERATALAVWSAGINIGIFLAFLAGGYLGHRYGWRTAFVACGIATVLAALLLRLTVREPERTPDTDASLRNATSLALIRATCRLMWIDPAMRHATIGATITATTGYAAISWMPSFLVRSHQLDIATVGLYLALVIGLGGGIMAMAGGKLADVLRRHDVRWSLWFVGTALIVVKPLTFTFYLAGDVVVALAAFVLPGMIATVYAGPSLAVLHNRIPPTLRPTASAILLAFVNLIGLGLGPLCVGMLSQWVFAAAGAHSLSYALAAMQALAIWGAVHFLIAGQGLARPPAA